MAQKGQEHATLLRELVSSPPLAMVSVALLREGVVYQRRSQIQISVCRGVSQVSVLFGSGVQSDESLSSDATQREPNRWHIAAHVPRPVDLPLPVVALKLQTLALVRLGQKSKSGASPNCAVQLSSGVQRSS